MPLWGRTPLQLVAGVGVLVITAALLPSTAGADVNSDKSHISQLEQRVEQDGAIVERLVAAYNAAESHAQQVQAQLDAARARVSTDQKEQSQALTTLRTVALQTYMSGSDDSALSVFEAGDGTSLAARQAYSQLAGAGIRNAIDAVTNDAQRTQADESVLSNQEAAAQVTLQQAAAARNSAARALAADDALLGQAKGDLATLLAGLAAQQAREREQEALLAAQSSRAVSFHVDPTPGTYVNPLRAINGLTPERVDQGVDYHGYGPIFAIGDGVVLSTSNSGWPGGTFIAYRLTDGPANGLVVYAAEDIYPNVAVGQSVNANTVLGSMYEGPDGIETGWADSSGDGNTMARDAGQFNGSNSTAYGANFSQLLQSIGAPPGVMQNEPPTGSLPPGWPTW